MRKLSLFLFFVTLSFLNTSCISKKRYTMLNDIESTNSSQKSGFEVSFQPDDLLIINISSRNSAVSQPYNLPSTDLGDNAVQINYQVDKFGYIEIPNLGKIKAAGETRQSLAEVISNALIDKVDNPMVIIRLVNFKFSVSGEVNIPGNYTVSSDRITLIEALSKAGDITFYGKRNNILIIRDENGAKSFQRIDITKSDFINSPYYYLAQNDVIYVEPTRLRVTTAIIGPTLAIALSSLTLLLTVYTLTKTN